MVALLLSMVQHGAAMNMKSSEFHGPLSTAKTCVEVSLEVPDSRGSGEQRHPSSSSTALVPAPQSKIPNQLGLAMQLDQMGRGIYVVSKFNEETGTCPSSHNHQAPLTPCSISFSSIAGLDKLVLHHYHGQFK